MFRVNEKTGVITSTKKYKEFIVPNEEYESKRQMAEKLGKRMFVSNTIELFTKNKAEGIYEYPPSAFKFLPQLTKHLLKLQHGTKRKIKIPITTGFENEVKLRAWQKDAKTKLVEKVNNYTTKSILIRAPTGGGKSFFIGYLVAKLNLPTAIVAPNASVVSGIYNEVIKFIKPEYVSLIKGSKDKMNLINVMHYQTFNRRYDEISGNYPLLIIDEAHYLPVKRRQQINGYKNLFLLIGFTATPYRKELSFDSIKKYFGDTLYYSDNIEKNVLDTNVIQIKHRTDFEINWVMKTIDKLGIDPNYQDIDRVLLYEQDERYEYVKRILDNVIENGYNKVIILADRTKYVDGLYDIISKEYNYTYKLSGKINRKKRSELISDMKTGKIDKYILVAQSSVGTTGLDIPALQVGILAYPTKWDGTVEQAVGRVRRSAEGKEKGLWIDICDIVSTEGSKPKYKGCNDRYKKYKELGFNIYKIKDIKELNLILKQIKNGDTEKSSKN